MTASSPRPTAAERAAMRYGGQVEPLVSFPPPVRPAAPLPDPRPCACGHSQTAHPVPTDCVRCTCTDYRPAVPDRPDTTGELREVIAKTVHAMDRQGRHVNCTWSELDGRQRGPYLRTADALLTTALRDLLAERDTLAAKVQAVRELCEAYPKRQLSHINVLAALDGPA